MMSIYQSRGISKVKSSIRNILLLIWFLKAAYGGFQNTACPDPCRCLKFEGLWSVYCNVSGLTDVPSGIPQNTQLLDLSRNSISQIPKAAFRGLLNLEWLDLSANVLSEQGIEEGALDLPSLQTIDLTANEYSTIPLHLPGNMTKLYFLYTKITNLTFFSFRNYQKLEYVDLSNNALNHIEPGTFAWLESLSTLYMQFNKLTNKCFTNKTFAKNTNLQLLALRFNKLTRVLEDLPKSIQYLDYVGNKIKILPSYGFQSLPNLQSMEFWEGEITTLEDNAFYGLHKLTILDFMQDKITSTLTKDTFNGLTGLQTLYMDLNNISRIEPGAFRFFGQIRSLWFSSNQLSVLEPKVLDENILKNLNEVFIDDNPWYCDCHLRWLREKLDNATYTIMDPHLIVCAGPEKLKGKAWDVVKPSDFVCN